MSGRLSAPSRLALRARRAPGLARLLARAHGRLYRLSGGRALGRWFGAPVLELETVGRRSGAVRRTALIYVEHGDDLLVMGANGGADRAPAWWLNLTAAGRGRVTVAGRSWDVTARVPRGDEGRELWAAFARAYSPVEEYRTFTERELPVAVLSRLGGR